MPSPLAQLSDDRLEQVLDHPAQQANVRRVAELLTALRACRRPADYDDFQRWLVAEILAAQRALGQVSRARKRAARRKPPLALPADAGEDLELEVLVRGRVEWQLRQVGDALAWRALRHDRQIILSLSCNDLPGLMADKRGHLTELGQVERLWREERQFTLVHDATTCLRIGDLLTVDDPTGPSRGHGLVEVKSSRRRSPAQTRRMRTAIAALDGGPLPGDNPQARLVATRLQAKTQLGHLRDALEIAGRHVNAVHVAPGGRVLVCQSLARGAELVQAAPVGRQEAVMAELRADAEAQVAKAFTRAGLDQTAQRLVISSRAPIYHPALAPPTIFPFDPMMCAQFTCGLLVATTAMAIERLVDALGDAGLEARVLVAGGTSPPHPDQPLLSINVPGQDVELRMYSTVLGQVLAELIDLPRWAAALREALRRQDLPDVPVLTFANEHAIWR